MKQSPRQWNRHFSKFLEKHNLRATDADTCVFVNYEKNLYLAIYVDDGLITAQNEDDMKKIINELQKEFEITIGWRSIEEKMDQYLLARKGMVKKYFRNLIWKEQYL